MTTTARRVLAVLECRGSDAAIVGHGVDMVARSGGFLTIVVVVPSPFHRFDAGTTCVPRMDTIELRAAAADVLAAATATVPSDVPLLTAIDAGPPAAVVRRRVRAAAHDLVLIRYRHSRILGVSARVVAANTRRPLLPASVFE
jgi:hypothetical protein